MGVYFQDTGLLIASLDEEAQSDLRENKNLNTFKGALYESIAGETLIKEGYKLFYYKQENSQLEMDFFIRNKSNLIPIEVKAKDGSTISLNNLISKEKYKDILFGIKFGDKNIGNNGKFYTFPYFTMFLLKRFINTLEKNKMDLIKSIFKRKLFNHIYKSFIREQCEICFISNILII